MQEPKKGNIAEKRAEILRLIAKVGRGGEPRPPTDSKAARRLAKRRRKLSEIKDRRRRVEAELAADQLADLVERVASIERRLAGGEGQGAAAEPAAPAALGPNVTLGGRIKEGLLADVLQMVSSNMMTGVFKLRDGRTRLALYYVEGEVCHAEGEGLVGEQAFFAAMALERGSYVFEETDAAPQQRTIESKTQFLILEALRQIDESRA